MINWIVTSSVLILVVAGLRFVLRGKISLRLQYVLWLVVLFRLLVPFDFGESSISLMNVVEQVPVVQEMDAVRNVETMERLNNGQVRIEYNMESQPGIPVTEILDMPEESYRQQKRSLNYHKITMGVWTAGMAVMFAIFIFTNLRLYCMLKKDREELKTDMTSLPVYVTRAVETPCLFGDLNPAIYVTPEVAENETVLRHTILHEMMHYRHHDLYWGFLRCVALSMHWYNPLVWWAAKLSKDDAELACDEAVIRKLGEEERYAYGKTLIEMTRPGRNTLLGTATTMTGSKSALKERIERIAKKPKMAAYTLAAVLVIAAVAVVCTMTGAEDRAFEEWLRDVKDSDIYYAQAYSGGGLTQISSILKNDKKEELAAILNGLTEDQIYQEEKADTDNASDYKLLVAEGASEEYEMEVLFHAFEDGTVSVTFDSKTAKTMERRGKTWWIDSMDLTQFIFIQVNSYGTGPTVTADVMNTDIDGDGQGEIFNVFTKDNQIYTLQISEEDGTVIWEEEAATAHVGWNTIMLYQPVSGSPALVRYNPYSSTGISGYSYQMFTLDDGKEKRIREDEVIFETGKPESYPETLKQFLEAINDIMSKCTILLSTQNGEAVIGPASPQKLQWANDDILAEIANFNSLVISAAEAMQNVRASDITYMEYMGSVTAEELAAALNNAVPNQITREEAGMLGYETDMNYRFWYGHAYTGAHINTGISGNDVRFEISCGLAEDVVEVMYGKYGSYSTGYFKDEELYNLVRYTHRERFGEIDPDAYNRFEDILVPKMEKHLKAHSESQPTIYDYEMVEFHHVLTYEEEDGSLVELYDFDYGLLVNDPEIVQFAGGMHFDGYLRLRGFNGGGQLAVRYRGGEMTAYSFMGNDFSYYGEEVDWFDGYEKQQKGRLKRALDYAEEQRQN